MYLEAADNISFIGFRQRTAQRFLICKIGHFNALADIERRAPRIADQITGCGNAEKDKGETSKGRDQGTGVINRADGGVKIIRERQAGVLSISSMKITTGTSVSIRSTS